jgi:antitoxin ParD1/3/4
LTILANEDMLKLVKMTGMRAFSDGSGIGMSTNAMETMNIALPGPMKVFIQSQVAQRGYSSASEYVRELIRADQDERALAELEGEILKGLQSGKPTPMTREDWKAIRQEVRKRHAKR